MAFRQVLMQVMGPDSANAVGLSLVPKVTAWPDSSLAQMLAWIATDRPTHGPAFDVRYVAETPTGFAEALESCAGRPVWVFGTAFHFVQLMDAKRTRILPRGSVVIETGGTKGRSREVTRADFYHDLGAAFGIGEEQIISEYGMCELACQAYDFVPKGERRAQAARRFRFPAWVSVSVVTAPRTSRDSGKGALCVADPLRIDVPSPIRTEDLVELAADGSFRLLGRSASAPLKGCSLLVDAVVLKKESRQKSKRKIPEDNLGSISLAKKTKPFEPVTFKRHAQTRSGEHLGILMGDTRRGLRTLVMTLNHAFEPSDRLPARAEHLGRFLKTYLFCGRMEGDTELNESTFNFLKNELGSGNAAASAIQDLWSGVPKSLAEWLSAVSKAEAQPGSRWIFLLPENHSLVGIYPLALAYVAGLKILVRVPGKFRRPDNFLMNFLDQLKELPDAQVQIYGPELRLGDVEIPADFVLCYGSDQTVNGIRAATSLPVQGFGHRVSVAVATPAGLEKNLNEFVRDFLGLGQLGCMSARLGFIVDEQGRGLVQEGDSHTWMEKIAQAGAAFWGVDLPWMQLVALDSEAFRLQECGFRTGFREAEAVPLVSYRCISATELSFEIAECALARSPFSIPILHVIGSGAKEAVRAALGELALTRSLGTVTVDQGQLNEVSAHLDNLGIGPTMSLRQLGKANAPVWDGIHEGKPLLGISPQK